MSSSKFQGQALFLECVKFITRYVIFPVEPTPYQAEILALWCLQTWIDFSPSFPICAYAQVAATTKRSGKTLVEHVARLLCQQSSDVLMTVRMLSVCRYVEQTIESTNKIPTLFFDECERLASNAAGDTRSMLAGGYKWGATHMVATNKETFWFRVFGPKMFAQIGDVVDVLFDRCIPFELRRATREPDANFYEETLSAEMAAGDIRSQIMAGGLRGDIAFVMPSFLNGRNREVFSPLWSVAVALQLDANTMSKITRAMIDMAASKDRPLRHFVNAEAEAAATDDGLSLRALRDLASVLPEPGKTATGDIFSEVAVERMKGLDLGPWRWVKGAPLTVRVLSQLIGPHVPARKLASLVSMERGRGKARARGYRREDILEALKRAEGGK